MIRNVIVCLLVLVSLTGNAHVGSPGITYEGNAGPYKLLVNIVPPDVIPGTAQVSIFIEGATDGVQISAKPVYFTTGTEGVPKSDEAIPSPEQPGRYDLKLWFMTSGASSVVVHVDGPAGKGEVVIPVIAVSTAVRTMPTGLGWGLLAMAVFLVVLMMTIIGSSVSDGQLVPEEAMTSKLKRRRLTGAFVSLGILLLILWGGKSWWDGLASDYRKYVYKPYQATTVADLENHTLTMTIDSALIRSMTRSRRFVTTRKLNYLIPDHGKLMHLFLVRVEGLNAFAHLHPKRLDSVTFESTLPPLPPGRYWLYADITRLSGFSETIVDTIDIPEARVLNASFYDRPRKPDRDDTWFVTNGINDNTSRLMNASVAICGSPGVKVPLHDAEGSSVLWEHDPSVSLKAGVLTTLKFSVINHPGQPAIVLEPYLGMLAHAVILKDDGSVYIHLHPNGSYSMGSQRALINRIAFHKPIAEYLPDPMVFADSINHVVSQLDDMDEATRNALLMPQMDHTKTGAGHNGHQVSFPYSFPKAGKYRIWIQVKKNGQLLNSAFDAEVKE